MRHTGVLQVLDVKNGDGDALLGQEEGDDLADAIAASGDDDHLLVPVVDVAAPVVHDTIAQPVAEDAGSAQDQSDLESVEVLRILADDLLSLGGVLSKQEEGKGELRVQDRRPDESEDGIEGNTCGLQVSPSRRIVAERCCRRTFTRHAPLASDRHADCSFLPTTDGYYKRSRRGMRDLGRHSFKGSSRINKGGVESDLSL